MAERNNGESILPMSNTQDSYLKAKPACEPYDQEVWRHTWASGTAPGWYICTTCAREAICPECLPAGAKKPRGAIIKPCLRHQPQ